MAKKGEHIPDIAGWKLDSEPLGKGALGEVYRAQKGPHVRAIKIVRSEVARSMGLDPNQMVRDEFEIQSQLDHPNIVKVYDNNPEGEDPYLITEFIDGSDLHTYLEARGALAIHECIGIFLSILDAIEYAHAQGVIHLDLKPRNVLVDQGTEGRRIKVTDFGASRRPLEKALEHSMTATKASLATVYYMSPEQKDRAEQLIGTRSDIYSLGMTFLKMSGNDISGPLIDIMMPLGAPPELKNIILKCLKRNPDDRYASVSDFKHELLALAETLPPEEGYSHAREQISRNVEIVTETISTRSEGSKLTKNWEQIERSVTLLAGIGAMVAVTQPAIAGIAAITALVGSILNNALFSYKKRKDLEVEPEHLAELKAEFARDMSALEQRLEDVIWRLSLAEDESNHDMVAGVKQTLRELPEALQEVQAEEGVPVSTDNPKPHSYSQGAERAYQNTVQLLPSFYHLEVVRSGDTPRTPVTDLDVILTQVVDAISEHGKGELGSASFLHELHRQITQLTAKANEGRLLEVINEVLEKRNEWASDALEGNEEALPAVSDKLLNARYAAQKLACKKKLQESLEYVLEHIGRIQVAHQSKQAVVLEQERLAQSTAKVREEFQQLALRTKKVERRRYSPLKLVPFFNRPQVEEPPRERQQIHQGQIDTTRRQYRDIGDALVRGFEEDIVSAFEALDFAKEIQFEKNLSAAEKVERIQLFKAAVGKKIQLLEALMAENAYAAKGEVFVNRADETITESTREIRQVLAAMHEGMVSSSEYSEFFDHSRVNIKPILKKSKGRKAVELSANEITKIMTFYESQTEITEAQFRTAVGELRDKLVADTEQICDRYRSGLAQRYRAQMTEISRACSQIAQQVGPIMAVLSRRLVGLKEPIRRYNKVRIRMNSIIGYLDEAKVGMNSLPRVKALEVKILEAVNEEEVRELKATVLGRDVEDAMGEIQDKIDAVAAERNYTAQDTMLRISIASNSWLKDALDEQHVLSKQFSQQLHEINQIFTDGCIDTANKLRGHWVTLFRLTKAHLSQYHATASQLEEQQQALVGVQKKIAAIEARFTSMAPDGGGLGEWLEDKLYTEGSKFHTKYIQREKAALDEIERLTHEAQRLREATASSAESSHDQEELEMLNAQVDAERSKLDALQHGTMLNTKGEIVLIPDNQRKALERGEGVPGIFIETYGKKAARKYYEDRYTAEFRKELDKDIQKEAEEMMIIQDNIERLKLEKKASRDRAILLGRLLEQEEGLIWGIIAMNATLEHSIARYREAMKMKLIKSLEKIVLESEQSTMRQQVDDEIRRKMDAIPSFTDIDELSAKLGVISAGAIDDMFKLSISI